MQNELDYGSAIREGFQYLLKNHPEVFVIGQGVWAPWYVGNSMTNLDVEFGKDRVIDTPVSEEACTGMAVGASLCGYKPIVIHPRMDFMILAMDPIVNQAAKWSYMLGGANNPSCTFRSIINRGGEQGAQHSQALHSWFAHIPGLRVVMPSTVQDARDLLIAATLCKDPVLYIDDRWLYERTEKLNPVNVTNLDLNTMGPKVTRDGKDITLVGAGYTTYQCELAAEELLKVNISAEVIDLRVINPLDISNVIQSVKKTGNLIVVDGGWRNCGLASEIVAGVTEIGGLKIFKNSPLRMTLPEVPAPSSHILEKAYYLKTNDIVEATIKMIQTHVMVC